MRDWLLDQRISQKKDLFGGLSLFRSVTLFLSSLQPRVVEYSIKINCPSLFKFFTMHEYLSLYFVCVRHQIASRAFVTSVMLTTPFKWCDLSTIHTLCKLFSAQQGYLYL